VDAALADLLRYEESLLAALTTAERDQLATLLRTVLAPLDEPD